MVRSVLRRQGYAACVNLAARASNHEARIGRQFNGATYSDATTGTL
jgi:hypothetical protein